MEKGNKKGSSFPLLFRKLSVSVKKPQKNRHKKLKVCIFKEKTSLKHSGNVMLFTLKVLFLLKHNLEKSIGLEFFHTMGARIFYAEI